MPTAPDYYVPTPDAGPPVAPVPPPPQTKDPLKPLPQKSVKSEFVAGGGSAWLGPYLRSLPQWIDDTTRDFGADLYNRMLRDEQVKSSVDNVIRQATADGVTVRPAVDDKDDPDFDKAKEILEFVERSLDGLERPLDLLLPEMLQCCAVGHKVAEQVYRDGDGKDGGKLCLDRIKVKPRRATAFVVDPYGAVTGLLAALPGRPLPTLTANNRAELAGFPLLPREKFLVLTWAPEDEDPRGNSLLRSAFRPWWEKMQLGAEHLKGLSQFGTPSLIGILGENAYTAPAVDSLGNPTGAPAITPMQDLFNQLVAFKNGTAIVGPPGTDIHALAVSGTGVALLAKLEHLDRRIDKAITGQVLAAQEAQHGTRAQATVHQDTMGAGLHYPKLLCGWTLKADVFRPLVRYNFGADAARRLCPYATLAATDQQDWAGELNAIANAYKSGFIKEEQLPALFERLGLPPVDPKTLLEIADAKRAALAAVPAAPPGLAKADAAAKDGGKQPAAFAEWDESAHPRDAVGRWTAATTAMTAAHPFPRERPPLTPGTGNPVMAAKDPALQAAKAVWDAHVGAMNRARIADLAHRLLHEPPDRPVRMPLEGESLGHRIGLTKRAIEAARNADADVITLGPAFARHATAAASAHPEGPAALAAARAEAERRHLAALAVAEAHIAGLPKDKQAQARKMLGGTADGGAAPAKFAADDDEGRWVTIEGVHVFIGADGKITKGPAHMVGKSPSELGKQAKSGGDNSDKASRTAHTASRTAHAVSESVAGFKSGEEKAEEYTRPAGDARRSAHEARVASRSGDHALAAEHHKSASYHHEDAAEAHANYTGGGNPTGHLHRDAEKIHRRAAKAHDRAAQAHRQAAKDGEKPPADADE